MNQNIFSEPEQSFERSGVVGKRFETRTLGKNTEYLIVETENGHEATVKEKACDFVYYILEGNGVFEIEGEEAACQPGDLVVIPAGTAFTYSGTLRMLLTVSPPFWPEQEEVVS